MIGKLRGFIDSLQEDKCIIDVAGVGYLVFLSQKTAHSLRDIEKRETSLTIETVVKEDAIELYGFISEIEKIWFLELTKVQGVGAKLALKILSFFSIEELAKALVSGDIKSFSKVSGVGPKLAQRLATELKDSPKKLGIDVGFYVNNSGLANNGNVEISGGQIAADALSALENLGYKKTDAIRAINIIVKNDAKITLENLITQSLRELTRR